MQEEESGVWAPLRTAAIFRMILPFLAPLEKPGEKGRPGGGRVVGVLLVARIHRFFSALKTGIVDRVHTRRECSNYRIIMCSWIPCRSPSVLRTSSISFQFLNAGGLSLRIFEGWIYVLRASARELAASNFNCTLGAGGPALEQAGISNTVGAPFLRVLCEGAGTTNACSGAATPLDPGKKSSSSLHSPAPGQLRPKDRNDNCSTATAPVRRPSLASLDCDAYTATSPRASSWSIR